MKKIPTLFVRDPQNMSRVLPAVHPACEWVYHGEGVATIKYDGTCVMYDGTSWWARREVKPDKPMPPNYKFVERDPVTGKSMGWEPIEQSAFAKYHAEALDYSDNVLNLASLGDWGSGTYELIGPKINGNPERVERHMLIEHKYVDQLKNVPRTYDELYTYLGALPVEGIVWHHPDGRMAKIKRRDFGHEWPVT